MKEKDYKKAVITCSQSDLEVWGISVVKPLDEVFILECFYDKILEMEMVKFKVELDDRPQFYFVIPKNFLKIKEEK